MTSFRRVIFQGGGPNGQGPNAILSIAFLVGVYFNTKKPK